METVSTLAACREGEKHQKGELKMKERIFGHTGIPVSEIGLGTWQLGGADWGEMDERHAFAIMEAAVDGGVTFFDTADVYGGGKSEKFIGEFLKKCPVDVFVATKLGRRGDPGWPGNFTLAAMRAHTEESLRNLGVDCLDLTQLHCLPTEVVREGRIFDHLRTLQQEGKIRYFGASVESVEEALICLEQEDLACLQIIFNIFRQKPIAAFFDKAKERKVALVVRLPLASGLLSGKFSRGTTFPEGDHRNYNRDGQFFNVGETFAGLPFDKGVEVADAVKSLVPSGMSTSQMALRWILDFDAVSTVIPGATRPEQVLENVTASELSPLGAELHRKLKTLYEKDVAPYIRGKY